MRTLLLSKEVARIEALVQHGNTSCRREESECFFDVKFYETKPNSFAIWVQSYEESKP
jgi:hypothetical protein